MRFPAFLRRGRALATNAALAAVSVGVALAGFEILARATDETNGPPIARLYTEYDPVLGWRHVPGAHAEFPQGSYTINSRGLRDLERPYEPPPGTERVLVLGDSFAEGYSVEFRDCVSRRLEADLAGPGRRVEVINGGVVGYSTDQELLFYRDEASRYGARTVVLFFFYNDILGNVLDRIDRAPKPRFTCDEPTLRLTATPLPPPPPRGEARLHLPPPYPWHSAALEWLRKRLSALPRAYDAAARLGLWSRFEPREAPPELRFFSREPPEVDARAWGCTQRLLGALAGEVASHGARLLVAYVPSKMEVSERDWGLTRLEYEIDERDWDLGKVARDLEATGADKGYPVLDLTPVLKSADNPILGGPYHVHGGHWNALGHRVAARSVADFLRRRGWVDR
jgi:lysophospholipase L1-like esterase